MGIVITGGSGLLGTELLKINSEIVAPTHSEVNVTDYPSLLNYLSDNKPDILIHAAAIIDNRILEKEPNKAILTNIIGTANVAMACNILKIRLVYISTDYVYDGEHGNCKETDPLKPFNFYAWTKIGGEASVNSVKNHLIIRTSFGANNFAYTSAFVDKWASKDYVDVIAPMIYDAAVSPITGVLNIGTERKTLFDYASRRNENVKPVKLSETNFFTPYDTSLNLQKWMDYKSERPIAKPHTKCRACGSESLTKYLDLGLMPLANNLEYTSLSAKQKERYPLQVLLCEDCGLSQLSVVIDPVEMYRYYTYRSSINKGYINHCMKMAADILEGKDNCIHIDIAGNDGTLLNVFRNHNITNYIPINVEPAANLAAISEAQGIETYCDFWGQDVVDKIATKYPQGADLITATNVFAHVDDIKGFLANVWEILNGEGILVIECPYVVDFIENMEWDTIYFEHLSYMSVSPIVKLCEKTGLRVINIEKQSIHGGTIRLTITSDVSERPLENSVLEFMKLENGDRSEYFKWAKEVDKSIKSFGQSILELKKQGNKIAAFAASAKGNTLLNAAMINTDLIDYIVDETPEKIGKFSPGTGIPIVYKDELTKNPPDYLVILSWNFSDEIMKKAKDSGFKGKFIIPIPEFTVI